MVRWLLLLICLAITLARDCLLSEISKGKWVYRANLTRKNYVCCGWDSNDWKDPEITEQCGLEDMPNKYVFRYGRIDRLVQVGEYSCVCDEAQHTRLTVSEREKYQWVPDDCTLLQWNATAFCEQLGTRKIMLIGDSTSSQSASALMNLIAAGEPRGLCAPQVMHHRYNTPSESRGLMSKLLYTFLPDIVVLNFGAHFQDVDIFRREVGEFLHHFIGEYRRNMNKKIHFVWRTHNAPFPGCVNFQAPVTAPPQQPSTFGWNLFNQFDEIAFNLTRPYNFQVIDMSPLKLRADAHQGKMAWTARQGDCLHFCLPGPVDLFANLMLHMLREHDQQAASQAGSQ